MVRENTSFRRAAEQIGHNLLPADAQLIERRKAFQRVLWQVRYNHFQELADNPARTKATLIGQIVYAIGKMTENGQFRDVVDAGLKLAKIEYGIEDQSVNVFQGLTQKDYDELKTRIRKLNDETSSGTSPAEKTKPN